MTLNERIIYLENTIKTLQSKIDELTGNTTSKGIAPTSIVGGNEDKSMNRPIDVRSGFGRIYGGPVIWNSQERDTPSIKSEIPTPADIDAVIPYNRHMHSRISGGALDINTTELVEFVYTTQNKNDPAYWQEEPKRAKTKKTDGSNEEVEKIGTIRAVFDPDTKTWGISAFEIDIAKCYFVQRDPTTGNIMLDANGNEMKSLLFDVGDYTKRSFAWDLKSKCWRLYASYAPDVDGNGNPNP
jgi:hypothetical protein